jgi:secondary thiamine-phosphate synthase enzyme
MLMLYRDIIKIETKVKSFYNITEKISQVVGESRLKDGLCNIFVKGTTAAMLINENDRMLVEDFRKLLELLAPEEKLYQHPENAHSHLRSAMLHNSLTIPVAGGKLLLGEWQSILLFEFDVTPRERDIVITVYGN